MRRLTLEIDHGGGAAGTIPDPSAHSDGGLDWCLRYGNAEAVRFQAASVIDTFDYILSQNITSKEAMRRLREMRAAYRDAAQPPDGQR